MANIEGHQNCTICHPDLNRKWAKRESKGFRERFSDRKRILDCKEEIMYFKEELDNVDLENVSEERAAELKEDIAALAELEMLCSADCNCEESCAVDINKAVEFEDKKNNVLDEEYLNSPEGRWETFKKEKAQSNIHDTNSNSIFYRGKSRKFGNSRSERLDRIINESSEDRNNRYKRESDYRDKVMERFRSILYRYGKEGFEYPTINIVNDLPFDRSKDKVVKPYCDSLVDLYFDPAFEAKSLPKALIDEILNSGKFKLTYGKKSSDCYLDGKWKEGIGELSNQTDPVVIIMLNGLISKFSTESKAAMDSFTEEEIKEHEKDIVAFAELDAVCSSDCDCEESCAADIDYEVKITNDIKLKSFVENNYRDYKKLVSEAEKAGVSQESLINVIAMLSDKNLKGIFDRLCNCQYKINTDGEIIKKIDIEKLRDKFLSIIKSHCIGDFYSVFEGKINKEIELLVENKVLSAFFINEISDSTKFYNIPQMINALKEVVREYV